MIANMMIANNTNNPIWSSGAIALIMDFSTTCKPTRKENDNLYLASKMQIICFISNSHRWQLMHYIHSAKLSWRIGIYRSDVNIIFFLSVTLISRVENFDISRRAVFRVFVLTWNSGDQFERPQYPDRSQRSQVHVCRWRYLCYTSVATTLLITTQCATYPKINTQSVLFI